MLRYCALLSACVLFEGCSDEGLAGYAPEGVWVLQEMNSAPVAAFVTLELAGARVSGKGPCNRYSATQTAPLPWFELGPIAASKRACAALPLESDYFQTIQAARQSEVSEDILILSDADGTALLTYRLQ